MIRFLKLFKYEIKWYLLFAFVAVITAFFQNLAVLFSDVESLKESFNFSTATINFAPAALLMISIFAIRENTILDINRALFMNNKHTNLLMVKIIGDVLKPLAGFIILFVVTLIMLASKGSLFLVPKEDIINTSYLCFSFSGLSLFIVTLVRMTLRIPTKLVRWLIYVFLGIVYGVLPIVGQTMVILESMGDETVGFTEFVQNTKWLSFVPILNAMHIGASAVGVIPAWTFIGPGMWGFVLIAIIFKKYARWNKEYLLL